MLTLPVLKSYIKMKTSLKASRILVDPLQNGSALKFFQNCTKMIFSLLRFFNIIILNIFFNYVAKFQLTEIGLRHIEVTENFFYEKATVKNAIFLRFSIFQIQKNLYERPFEKTTLFTTYFVTEFFCQ